MIRANIKTAGAPIVIEPMETWNGHVIVAATKLDDSDQHLHRGDREQEKQKPNARLGFSEYAGDEQVNQQASQHRIDVSAGQVFHRREKGATNYIT